MMHGQKNIKLNTVVVYSYSVARTCHIIVQTVYTWRCTYLSV